MFKRILVPIDLNQKTSWVTTLPVASALASASGGTIDVLTVIPDFGMTIVGSYFPAGFEKQAIEETKVRLKQLAQQELVDGVPFKLHVAHGTVYEEIMEAAKEVGADLIVMASHRPELKDYLLGPNAARVARHARQSVMIVRPQGG